MARKSTTKTEVLTEALTKAVEGALACAGTYNKDVASQVGHIHIKAEPDGLLIGSNGIEVGMSTRVLGKMGKEFEFLIPGPLFLALLKTLPQDKTIALQSYRKKLKYESPGGNGTFNSCSVEYLEAKPWPNDGKSDMRLTFEDITAMIKWVSRSVSTNNAREILMSVYLEVGNDKVIAIGIDGFRLAHWTRPIDTVREAKYLLPIRSLVSAIKCFSAEDEIQVTSLDNKVYLTDQVTTVCILETVGNFPNWRETVPTYSNKATFDTDELVVALKRARIFRENGPVAKIDIGEKVTVRSASEQLGNTKTTVTPVHTNSTTEVTIGLFNEYLYEMAGTFFSDQIDMYWANKEDAVIFGDPKGDYHLIMPMYLGQ